MGWTYLTLFNFSSTKYSAMGEKAEQLLVIIAGMLVAYCLQKVLWLSVYN